jgi:hypothetical protein
LANKIIDLSEVIAENFGANATYVEGLLSRFRSSPDLVDESWRAYFAELLGETPTAADEPSENGRGAATPAVATEAIKRETVLPVSARGGAAATPERESAPAPQLAGEATPIRGAALKIVENMQASLGVPPPRRNAASR